MSNCVAARPAPLRCPLKFEIVLQLLALLPRGRAWGGGIPAEAIEAAFDPDAFDPGAFSTESRAGSILWRFWAAFADTLAFLSQRACDLREEFFCATHAETHPEWMAEYGLPDSCDPFPDLCAKVAAQGGARCEYFADVAARAGWAISACVTGPGSLEITINTGQSASYVGGDQTPPLAGCMFAGQPMSCSADIAPLICLLERILPAHLAVTYHTV